MCIYRCSFDINEYGEITKVWHSVNELPFVLGLKKTILGTLSSRLIVSESQNERQKRWAYKANEIGHEGFYLLFLKRNNNTQ